MGNNSQHPEGVFMDMAIKSSASNLCKVNAINVRSADDSQLLGIFSAKAWEKVTTEPDGAIIVEGKTKRYRFTDAKAFLVGGSTPFFRRMPQAQPAPEPGPIVDNPNCGDCRGGEGPCHCKAA